MMKIIRAVIKQRRINLYVRSIIHCIIFCWRLTALEYRKRICKPSKEDLVIYWQPLGMIGSVIS